MSDPLQFTYESTPDAWRCYYDPEGPQGFGKTKDEALFDLWLSCGEEEPLMKAIVAALETKPVPAGWKLVPIEATERMKILGDHAGWWCGDKYRAMVDAAPEPPAAGDGHAVRAD